METSVGQLRQKRSVAKALLLTGMALLAIFGVYHSGALSSVSGCTNCTLKNGEQLDDKQVTAAMWELQHTLRQLVDNQQQMQRMLRSSVVAKAQPVPPEQVVEMTRMLQQVATGVEQRLQQVTQDAAAMRALTEQMADVLRRADRGVHSQEFRQLLQRNAQRASERRLSSAFQQPLMARAPSVKAPPAAARTGPAVMESKEDVAKLAMELNPVVGYWDPLDLNGGDFWGQGEEATIGFLRHSEIKHGRVAMAAVVGWLVHQSGIHFPGYLTMSGTTFADISAAGGPGDMWDAMPYTSKLQIVLFIGFLELFSESSATLAADGQTHYMRGGKPGYFPTFKLLPGSLNRDPPAKFFDPAGIQNDWDEKKKAVYRLREINNGRLAMFGIIGFCAESKIPGAVPLLDGLVEPYYGEYMTPFLLEELNGSPFLLPFP
jgi:hypothetical protein